MKEGFSFDFLVNIQNMAILEDWILNIIWWLDRVPEHSNGNHEAIKYALECSVVWWRSG
jgi:hypothetical protein